MSAVKRDLAPSDVPKSWLASGRGEDGAQLALRWHLGPGLLALRQADPYLLHRIVGCQAAPLRLGHQNGQAPDHILGQGPRAPAGEPLGRRTPAPAARSAWTASPADRVGGPLRMTFSLTIRHVILCSAMTVVLASWSGCVRPPDQLGRSTAELVEAWERYSVPSGIAQCVGEVVRIEGERGLSPLYRDSWDTGTTFDLRGASWESRPSSPAGKPKLLSDSVWCRLGWLSA